MTKLLYISPDLVGSRSQSHDFFRHLMIIFLTSRQEAGQKHPSIFRLIMMFALVLRLKALSGE